jgi:hypothetical protein
MANAKRGSLLAITAGEFSDHYTLGFFVVLTDFDPAEQMAKYLAENHEQIGDYNFEESQFLRWLITKGLLLEIEHGELFLGAYGCADGMNFTPAV